MAVLLAWVNWCGAPIDACLWQRLQCHALTRAGGQLFEQHGDGFALLGIRTRVRARPPVDHCSDGRSVLIDAQSQRSVDLLVQQPDDLPAAVIAVDSVNQRVRMLRDRLGQRPLVWARVAGGILIASGEDLLLRHPQVAHELDADFLAAYFGACAPGGERSAFAAIRTLAPGTALTIDAHGERYEHLQSEPLDCAAWSDQRVSDELGAQLKSAISGDCAGASRLALSLSGGLDSSSIAVWFPATAANAVAMTYGCDYDSDLDERPWGRDLATRLDLAWSGLAIDTLGPLAGGERPTCPDTPFASPYREIKTALYKQLSLAAVDVLLTGNFADHLNANADSWVKDALCAGRLDVLVSGYRNICAATGWRGLWRDPGWRGVMRGAARPVTAPWLTPMATERVLGIHFDRPIPNPWPHPVQAAHALGSYAAFDTAGETYFAQQHGIELRHPYRYWPLVRLALSLPGFHSWRGSTSKWAIRSALQGHLPERWRLRPKSTSMHPLFARALSGTGLQQARALVQRHQDAWSSYVDVRHARATLARGPQGDVEDLLLWLLIGYALWAELPRFRRDVSPTI